MSKMIKKVLGAERFETFILLIDSIHKSINRVKLDVVQDSSVKSVHTLWLYELLKHPEGLTATEIASKSKIDRSLVSREMRALLKGGYISSADSSGKRGYNERLILTENGMRLAEGIAESALLVQQSVSRDISVEELSVFYSVLERISANLTEVNKKGKVSTNNG